MWENCSGPLHEWWQTCRCCEQDKSMVDLGCKGWTAQHHGDFLVLMKMWGCQWLQNISFVNTSIPHTPLNTDVPWMVPLMEDSASLGWTSPLPLLALQLTPFQPHILYHKADSYYGISGLLRWFHQPNACPPGRPDFSLFSNSALI